jgi:phosphohistidine phosphatase
MLTLALLRHAKSSWANPGLTDFDRPLNARGEAAAPVMGEALAALKIRPDLTICSPSRRTRETLALAAPKLAKGKPRITFDERVYLASASELLRIVREIDPAHATVLLIGHNPGLENFALKMAGDGDPGDIGRMAEKFPTAALAVLRFDAAAWSAVRPGSGRLETFITPKDRA